MEERETSSTKGNPTQVTEVETNPVLQTLLTLAFGKPHKPTFSDVLK